LRPREENPSLSRSGPVSQHLVPCLIPALECDRAVRRLIFPFIRPRPIAIQNGTFW
jgi:hypothetical protein